MTVASTICRYLLGVIFTVFGSNGFIHFIKAPPPATALAGQFMGAAFESHFMALIFAFQLLAGILLLVDYYVPFALVVLAGVLINILNYHVTMDLAGIPPGIVATVLWFGTALKYGKNFEGIFAAKGDTGSRETQHGLQQW